MKLSITSIAIVLAALLVFPSVGYSASCKKMKVKKLTFKRTVGKTYGTLSWRKVRRGAKYRVYRNGKILGQTRKNRMRVNVTLDKRYAFVVKVMRGKRTSSCSRAAIRRFVGFKAPGAPQGLTVSEVTNSQISLSWLPGSRGDGRFAGYRLYRNGVPYKQLTNTSISMSLTASRHYSFFVRAADTRGRLSEASSTINMNTDLRPPTTPGNLRASVISDSKIDLSWSGSSAKLGRVVGYRVYRDGKLLTQTTNTSLSVANLFPARLYRFTVAAVDSFGFMSAPTPQVNASTQPPPPTRGSVHAYLLATTDNSFHDLQANYRSIGTIHPTYYECNRATGQLEGKDDPLVTDWAQLRKIKVLARYDCQSGSTIHQILTNPTLREQTLQTLSSLASTNGYDGISIDFEAGYASDRAAYTSFIAELSDRMHAKGKLVSLAASPKTKDSLTHSRSGIFDYPELAKHSDWIFVMNWGMHWSTSVPGAIAPYEWNEQVADYVATMPQKRKFILSTHLYGMDWKNGGGSGNPATPLEYADIQKLISREGVTPQYDDNQKEWHFSYTDNSGDNHQVWYVNAQTVGERIKLAKDRGLNVGFWRLGREDQNLWKSALIAPGSIWP